MPWQRPRVRSCRMMPRVGGSHVTGCTFCHNTPTALIPKPTFFGTQRGDRAMFFSDSGPCVGCECLNISCKVSHVSGGFMAAVKNNCYSKQFVFFFRQLYVHSVLYFVIFFLSVPEKTKLLLWVFYRLACILKYLLASLVTMTRIARRLCSVISSSGMTLTVAHSGEGGENQLSKSWHSDMLFAFFGKVGSSAAGRQRSGKAQRR